MLYRGGGRRRQAAATRRQLRARPPCARRLLCLQLRRRVLHVGPDLGQPLPRPLYPLVFGIRVERGVELGWWSTERVGRQQGTVSRSPTSDGRTAKKYGTGGRCTALMY